MKYLTKEAIRKKTERAEIAQFAAQLPVEVRESSKPTSKKQESSSTTWQAFSSSQDLRGNAVWHADGNAADTTSHSDEDRLAEQARKLLQAQDTVDAKSAAKASPKPSQMPSIADDAGVAGVGRKRKVSRSPNCTNVMIAAAIFVSATIFFNYPRLRQIWDSLRAG